MNSKCFRSGSCVVTVHPDGDGFGGAAYRLLDVEVVSHGATVDVSTPGGYLVAIPGIIDSITITGRVAGPPSTDAPDDAVRLALAVLAGDREAALLLADCVQQEWLTTA